jgi:hypothetical protein
MNLAWNKHPQIAKNFKARAFFRVYWAIAKSAGIDMLLVDTDVVPRYAAWRARIVTGSMNVKPSGWSNRIRRL